VAATLTPINCPCGRLIGYQIRAGVAHHSTETHDPYEVSGLVLKERGGWIIGPLSGELYLGFVADLRRALRPIGVQKVRWERAKKRGLKDVREVVEKGGLTAGRVMEQAEGR